MSTISPSVTKEISKKLKMKNVEMLDAPISGGDVGAINGTLSIMVGGSSEILERCRPIFEAMGKAITHCGTNGMGQTRNLDWMHTQWLKQQKAVPLVLGN
jgi:3-hydroxyisobutyrate dehydrogenase-like beta-hydroxyacid dehydrogenase